MKKILMAAFIPAMLLAVACNNGENSRGDENENNTGINNELPPIEETEISAPGADETPEVVNQADMAVMTFDRDMVVYPDSVKEGEKVSHTYNITNTGKSGLFIHEVRPICGCVVSEYTKDTIPPGKMGKITVTFDSKERPGRNDKAIIVRANTIPDVKELRLVVNVKPKLQLPTKQEEVPNN